MHGHLENGLPKMPWVFPIREVWYATARHTSAEAVTDDR
jgi:hypothetical protein